MKKKISLMLCLLAAAGLLMTGCSGGDSEDTTSEITDVQTTIGQEQEGAYAVAMDNQVGQDITAVAVKLTSEESYPDSLMEEEQTWSQGETALVYYLPEETDDSQVSQTESGVAISDGYEMLLTLEDGSTLEFTTVPFDDMEVCTLLVEDGVPYLEYTSLSTQEEVSTLAAETAAAALAQQQAEQAAAEQAAAEQAAAEQAAAEQAAAEQAAAEQAAAEQAAAEQAAAQTAAAQAAAEQAAAEQAAAEQAAAEQAAAEQAAAQAAAQLAAQQEAAAQEEQEQEQEEEGCLAGAYIS